jgi:hypothetical protein
MAGLRLVAYYFDRDEAFVVKAALDAAGFVCFIHGDRIIDVRWDLNLAAGGYRILVPEEELADAVQLLRDAMRDPIREGGSLERGDSLVEQLFCAAVLFSSWWFFYCPIPLRFRRWKETGRP